ncbi:MAG: TatD family hydrolase [Deltaproteobacteria bacterium]|nr:TatD family hydrolase [Deltaproteobacteria bacterium]MBW2111265.1 TatD family hydrolase [Deltaproteobacteria bacterium]MBW2353860.1 TatD family hydrolase [Deltaproteobacteria bacterium]
MLIDSHAHLDMDDFDKDRGEVLERAVQGGIDHIISIGIDPESSEAALDLAREYGYISATVGIHPHSADDFDRPDLDILAEKASAPEVVAWGEIGLDFFRNYSAPEAQLRLFRQQLTMAQDLGLPVIIHDREAHDQVYSALKSMGRGEARGVVHCFSGDRDLAEALIGLGYFISIPGTVTYKKALRVKEVAASIPLERMLVETDSPFLAPVPRRGKRNEPFNVTYTAREIARLRNISLEEVALQTSRNAKILFNLPWR